jgi:hypothetical protein
MLQLKSGLMVMGHQEDLLYVKERLGSTYCGIILDNQSNGVLAHRVPVVLPAKPQQPLPMT